ncbi:DUF1566 domain-containing protein [Pseudoalteromonas sp. T1lg65]|uniref:Lcl C-terminal domain-containing protein n=1 Tax=Pseudoalteromonas sp. T1lg65 TaxID=2077101 RepID=UPI003F7AB766
MMHQTRVTVSVLAAVALGACGYAKYQDLSQSAHTPTYEPRFIKMTKSGELLKPWQGPWHCIYDKKLNLVWENKTDNEDIHDGYWSYSWYINHTGSANQGDCFFESTRCDTQDIIRRSNLQHHCGFNNWRLPSKAELTSLLTPAQTPGKANLREDYFSHIKSGDYWTGEANQKLPAHFQHLGSGAVTVDFYQGVTRVLPYRNAAFVILVADISESHLLSIR